MKKFIFMLCLITTLVPWVFAVTFSDCGSKEGKVTAVEIVGCNTSSTCILKRGGNATIEIKFVSGGEAQEVSSVVHGIIQGVPVPFNFPYPNGCSYGGLTCPLSQNVAYTYTATLPIKKIYPKIHLQIKWQLQNENDEDIVCITIPVQIK